jgi:hypothetical protein
MSRLASVERPRVAAAEFKVNSKRNAENRVQ